MASGQTSKNRVYLFRLQILLIDGGNIVIKNIFNQKLKSQNSTLTVCLAQEKQTIVRLKTKKAITKTQYDLLFPQGGQAPSIANFDISLTICLLRSLKMFGLNPKYNWKSAPLSTDLSVEADITRLRTYRNEIAHISETTGIQLKDFCFKWTEIEQILLRLNNTALNPVSDLQQILNDFKTCSLDPDTEQRLQKEIDVWRDFEKGLDENIQRMQKVVQANTEGIFTLKRDFKADVATLKQATLENSERLEDTSKRVDKLENLAVKQEDNYQMQKQGLQEDLIEFFRCRYSAITLSPLVEEEDTPLLTFYQIPDINLVTFQRGRGGGREERTTIELFRDIFLKGNTICKEIYLTADAGLGKTSLSKRLVLTWCHAKKPIPNNAEHFSQEEIGTMDGFDFVFLLLLRDCHKNCDIDDLILNHIVSRLARDNLSLDDLQKIMFTERCLVILDGLDEWIHPSSSCKQGWSYIPHRKARQCTVVLTTTRPWKLYASDIKNSQIDQNLEIVGLSRESANLIKKKVISYLFGEKDENELEKCINNFATVVQEKELTDLEAVPLLLMYLLCLWYENIELGESQCELYSDIIELLLSRTVKKYKYMSTLIKPAQNDIPQCFSKQTHCEKFYSLLTSLAKLAYLTLFNKTRESTLVFDNEIAEECLNKEFMKVCLQSGILSQSKVQGKLTKKEAKVSFAHKSVQEFFAALYMNSAPDQSTLLKSVLSQCNSVNDILEMSKVFIFLSGINGDVLSLISREFIEIINEDEITQKYRTMTFVYEYEKYTKPLKELQNMYISCMKENPKNADLKLFHQDIIIDEDCRQEKYFKCLQHLVVQNKENIRSVSVEMKGIPYSAHEIMDNFELTDLSNLDKILYQGEFDNCDIIPLIHRSVKVLTLDSNRWQDNDFIVETSTWSAPLSSRFYSLDNLEGIDIECFEFSHSELEKLVYHLSTRNSMREISLYNLYCTDHEDSCAGFTLDLSQHSQLRSLLLGFIPLSDLNINLASLEECEVGRFSKPGLVSHFLKSLPAASMLQKFMCSSLESTKDIETMLAVLPELVHVKQVVLGDIHLGDRDLPLSPEMVNIELVLLDEVTMTASVLRRLRKLQKTVTIHIQDCSITSRDWIKSRRKREAVARFQRLKGRFRSTLW